MERVLDLAALRSWHDVLVAASTVDEPVAPTVRTLDEHLPYLSDDGEMPGWRTELWGSDSAAAQVQLPRRDNLDRAVVELCVHPARRRRGVGSLALQEVLDRCRALGRSVVEVQVRGPLDGPPSPGEAFAAAHGFLPALAEVRRVLDLSAVADPVTDVPAGYEIGSWVDHAPAALVDGLAAVEAYMSTDAPQGEKTSEPEVWDAERWLAREANTIARGRLNVGTWCTWRGEVVGYSDVGVPRSQPETAYQWETIVRRDHRGHGLGLVLKAVNHAALRAASPATRWVTTWNAASNVHMIAINEVLGFRAVDRWTAYEHVLPQPG